jgi:hypothetical protein
MNLASNTAPATATTRHALELTLSRSISCDDIDLPTCSHASMIMLSTGSMSFCPAADLLGWKPRKSDLSQQVRDAWHWMQVAP